MAFDLSQEDKIFTLEQLKNVSPRVAAAYADKTGRTVIRDVNTLLEMGLIIKETNGYRTNKEIILAFLPGKLKKQPAIFV